MSAQLGTTRITWGADLAHLPDAVRVAAHVPSERVALRTSSMDAQLHAARAGLGAVLVGWPFMDWTGLGPLRLDPSLRERLGPLPRGALRLVGQRALRALPPSRSSGTS